MGLGYRNRTIFNSASNTEVHDLHLAGVGQHDVSRLNITVHNAVTVRVAQRLQHARNNLASLINGYRFTLA